MSDKTAIFKIGGSILENNVYLKSTISQLNQLYKENLIHKIILIPGGGSYANFVRHLDKSLNLGEDLSHWMAIYSMNYNGKLLSNKYSDLICVENLEELNKFDSVFAIFLPYETLRREDVLPHNWDVTSDSIALYFAKNLGLDKCFLIKDIDGILNKENQIIKEISTIKFKKIRESGYLFEYKSDELKTQSRPLDPYIITMIEKYKISCIILNGNSKNQRIVDFFNEAKSMQEKIFTLIK